MTDLVAKEASQEPPNGQFWSLSVQYARQVVGSCFVNRQKSKSSILKGPEPGDVR